MRIVPKLNLVHGAQLNRRATAEKRPNECQLGVMSLLTLQISDEGEEAHRPSGVRTRGQVLADRGGLCSVGNTQGPM
jgi:hypothetical protein